MHCCVKPRKLGAPLVSLSSGFIRTTGTFPGPRRRRVISFFSSPSSRQPQFPVCRLPHTPGLRVGFLTFPRCSCDAHRTPVPHLIRTIGTPLGPLRHRVNPFFSSPSSRYPLVF